MCNLAIIQRYIIQCLYNDGYETYNGIKIGNEYPSQPADLITLHLVPFEMTEQHLETLENKGWEKIEKNLFGKVQHYPKIKTGYVMYNIHNIYIVYIYIYIYITYPVFIFR